ncbi:3' terminal RNA ribose 2'-O-methyltransferase Hen1 [Actinomadura sp. DC4]|uniref:3' terminal RNA ribose 2'-O-methyltransferase Hen1 n=1 Tax=Actinomadura sp. DC4 TaxID=3055069 RepID=UPI0025B26DA3|nr:3' terminal RNA ribose 2'-O-methyltransferase Hen1 [Actinomadura sp. DC4]MDN3355067.1 3' terminal RNA ribose 2'-O-methyltransferase Hen1 [Actinomadura sp. DC4]
MLLTITTTARPATDLGYLLVKHPGRVQAFEQSFGTAHVFYPEAGEDRCTAALLLDVDPIKLAKTRKTPDISLGQYVNDRAYAASSLLASAMADVFRTAMRGHSAGRPELAATPIPLRITLPALPCRGGPEVAAGLFEPLGWSVDARPVPLDERFPAWGDSRYVTLTLEGELTLSAALNQVYVLLPVLDDSKHYWIAADEVDKLIRAGEGWLAAHPARERITRRYLANRRGLVRTALTRLADADGSSDDALDPHPIDEEPSAAEPGAPGEAAAPPVPLAERRVEAVLDALRAEQAATVIDLGCGSGRLLSRLLQEPHVRSVAGTDVSARAMAAARRRLDPLRLPLAVRDRIDLFGAALTYADERFRGYDAAVLMEVIEHVDVPRLPAVEHVVFGDAVPRVVIVTTPNAEYNVRYEGLTGHRHPDHRFEWTREEFGAWTARVADAYGYRVRHVPVGDDDPEVGAPTQMGVFTR